MSERQIGIAALAWRKSTYSNGGEGCVELAVADVAMITRGRRENGFSEGVEPAVAADVSSSGSRQVTAGGGLYLVRDSKNPGGPVLAFTPGDWAAFVRGIKQGEFGPQR
ncbi:DUF397 domain-containing protein [Sphaerisporangium album]|uniref:DUF397 domain-containing protein n=2 Tax=Sphaerisporangium album TaxID=509200 RepID=A0A367FRR3_9ACTN|nr:DUF397 domain-containing protein [Sphaerisporangium album]